MTPSTDSSGISQTLKRGIIIAHDLVATALAFGGCLILRYQFWQLAPMLDEIVRIMPCFVLVAGIVYRIFPLYASKWRFASLPDLFNIFKASSLLSVLMLAGDYVLVARNLSPWLMFGEKTVVIYWLLQMFLLGGPRLAYRYLKYVQSRRVGDRENVSSVLVLGRATEAEVVLRALETGMRRRFVARAILSPRRSDYGTSIRNVPVLGNYAELERIVSEAQDGNQPITRIIFAPNEFLPESESEMLLATANRLGIPLSRMQAIEEGTIVKAALKPVAIEDLLFRPSVEVDRTMLADLMHGKRAIVTGGGGSIGSEICARLVAFGISELLILDHSEPALYNILESLTPLCTATVTLSGKIADVRDRERIFTLFRDFKPDLVFHAAALKQVPFLEIDWTEAIKTNVFGSVNIADAAAQTASAAVLISTDKAVDPVSVLGATKRLCEIYAQLLDAEAAAASKPVRLLSVRFGNVLGSVGSVVPRFKAQIERGGPVTVTHPEMVRYFMTVREACDLVLTASAHALGRKPSNNERASVYVLKMGQPARIVDLATRMIRMAGFEPGRDMEIVFTGIRKGERLNEALFTGDEPLLDIGVDGVTAARAVGYDRIRIGRWLEMLQSSIATGNRGEADRVFAEAIPSFAKLLKERASGKVIDLNAARSASEDRGSPGDSEVSAGQAGAMRT